MHDVGPEFSVNAPQPEYGLQVVPGRQRPYQVPAFHLPYIAVEQRPHLSVVRSCGHDDLVSGAAQFVGDIDHYTLRAAETAARDDLEDSHVFDRKRMNGSASLHR